jgi:hypothetical protein
MIAITSSVIQSMLKYARGLDADAKSTRPPRGNVKSSTRELSLRHGFAVVRRLSPTRAGERPD